MQFLNSFCYESLKTKKVHALVGTLKMNEWLKKKCSSYKTLDRIAKFSEIDS